MKKYLVAAVTGVSLFAMAGAAFSQVAYPGAPVPDPGTAKPVAVAASGTTPWRGQMPMMRNGINVEGRGMMGSYGTNGRGMMGGYGAREQGPLRGLLAVRLVVGGITILLVWGVLASMIMALCAWTKKMKK